MHPANRPVTPPSQPSLPSGAASKLVIEKFADGPVACLKFIGTIDEAFEGKKLGMTVAAETLVLDLGGVAKISSFGIREWVDFVAAAGKHARAMILIECSPKVVDQLNMVANFAGGGRVFSFYAPFRCDYCDSEHRVVLQIDRDFEAIKAMKLAERPCLSCKESMYFDEDGATYFSYLLGQDRFQLEPAVEAFLARKLNYAVSDLNRKLRVDKVIEGRTTYLRLDGDLDGSFPRDKLAEGLEGTVIVDLGAIGRIEPVGAMEWRGFIAMVAPVAERVCLASAPPAFIEKLCTRDDLNPKVQLLTVLMPYTCAGCGTTSAHDVDVGAHYDVLKFATAPELRCPRCKHAMQCHAGEAVMTLLPTMPRPTAGPELVKSIAILRERARAATGSTRRQPGASGSSPMLPSGPLASRASPAVPILVALLAVVVAAGGYLAYQRVTGKPAPAGLGAVTSRSAAARPAWIASDAPAAATCTEAAGKALSCVGVSSVSARQDDAEDEAADAALDAVASALAIRITDARWQHAVPPIYAAARDAKLAAFDRDPSSTRARREVREARHAVAQALRATGGGAVPPTPTGRYWEEYQGADGKRTLAFAQVTLGPAELARLVEGYTRSASALGATTVGMFPLISWRYPRLEHGAVIVALAGGPLQELGLAEQYVVLGIGGREVGDAAAFAQLAGDEYAGLVARGGTLRLQVQADGGVPREFARPIRAAPAEVTPGPGSARHPRTPSPGTPAGTNVNVWDKLGGGKGSGRDDPTQ
jgi:anti-anti-sigma regulatory factor/DNA-directed RNA polymerase subunit RPC12/RpoP